MRVPLDWLGDLVDLGGRSADDVGEILTLGLCEVEHVETGGLGVTGVVAGRLVDVAPHPEADKLRVATVDDGSGEMLQIVCGAPNIAAGQTVPVARVGARLPGESPDKPFKIKKSKIRGVRSQGMLCSQRELGLGDDHEGILQLTEAPAPGTPLEDVLPGASPVLVIDNKSLTHRPDCWGLAGLAREFGALTGVTAKSYEELGLDTVPGGAAASVDNHDPQRCPRYHALRISGLTVGPSPRRWVDRLEAAGVRAINNVVDATNLVLLETGQPLHAFDERDVDLPIIVRRSAAGERLTTLDEVERTLDEEDLVIADRRQPLALAGVMGGLGSSVRDDTKTILLEGANFEAGGIRRTSLRHGLRSESSARFEKGLPAWLVGIGLRRCVALLRETCPALEVSGDLGWKAGEPHEVEVSADLVSRRLGRVLTPDEVAERLGRLGFTCSVAQDSVCCAVPPWRGPRDIVLPEDLIEEIGRLEGFATLTPTLPRLEGRPATLHPHRALERRLRRALAWGAGCRETSSYSFISDERREQLGCGETPWRLRNPVQEDHRAMRPTLLGGLLDALAVNHRQRDGFDLFEIGTVFDPSAATGPESGRRRVAGCSRRGEVSFAEAKAAVQAVIEELHLSRVSWRRADTVPVWAHPGRCAELVAPGKTDIVLGILAEIHPKLLVDLDVEGRAALWELDLEGCTSAPASAVSFKPLPRFPAVTRDLALVVDEGVAVGDIADVIGAHHRWLRHVELFDIYRGKGLDEGKKSLAFHLTWQDPDATLTDKAVDTVESALIETLANRGWERR